MEIHLLRHGIAVDRADHHGRDAERELTAQGRRKVRRVARAMSAQKLSFEVIFSSPLVRAAQTAAIVAESLRLKRRLQLSEYLTPETPVERQVVWLETVGRTHGSVLLVGHEPSLSELTSYLLSGRRRIAIDFKKAGLCALTADRIGPGGAILQWLLTPKQMELMR